MFLLSSPTHFETQKFLSIVSSSENKLPRKLAHRISLLNKYKPSGILRCTVKEQGEFLVVKQIEIKYLLQDLNLKDLRRSR